MLRFLVVNIETLLGIQNVESCAWLYDERFAFHFKYFVNCYEFMFFLSMLAVQLNAKQILV